MKTIRTSLASILLLSCLVLSQKSLPGADAKWESLFNGKDLSGWTSVNDTTFEVKDGNLRLVKGMGWLRTEKQYQDFVLEFEWRAIDKQYDSGVFFRAGLEGKPWPKDGWQVNLNYSSLGSLVKGYKVIKPSETERIAVNDWAKFRIEVRGKKVTLDVNGERAWEYEGIDSAKGYIGIQAENKAFDFRNLRVQELAN
jgi:hypothetical protein